MEKKDILFSDIDNRLDGIVSIPGKIALFENVRALHNGNLRTDAYMTVICINGKATCKIDDKTYEIANNDVFFVHPNQFVENAMTSFDFNCCGAILSPEYLESVFILGGKLWNQKLAVIANPLLHLDQYETDMLKDDFNFLRQKITHQYSKNHKEVIELLLQVIMYDVYDCIASKIEPAPVTYTSADSLFGRFMELVSNDTPQHRDVNYYACELCVTPKYLSSVCKKMTGKTALVLIKQAVTKHIRHMLRASDKSIKEIAAETGFENLSFFGKYVRRELGMSPREYRVKY